MNKCQMLKMYRNYKRLIVRAKKNISDARHYISLEIEPSGKESIEGRQYIKLSSKAN